jgi:hypothetical protein
MRVVGQAARLRTFHLVADFAALLTVAFGTSRHFAAAQQLRRFRAEADIGAGFYSVPKPSRPLRLSASPSYSAGLEFELTCVAQSVEVA